MELHSQLLLLPGIPYLPGIPGNLRCADITTMLACCLPNHSCAAVLCEQTCALRFIACLLVESPQHQAFCTQI